MYRRRVSRRLTVLSLLAGLLGCSGRAQPITAHAPDPIENAPVGVGSLVQAESSVTLDVLIPADGDIPRALRAATADATKRGLQGATVTLHSLDDEGWGSRSRLPGYVVSLIDETELELAFEASGVIRISAHGPADTAWDLVRRATIVAADVAGDQAGWIYDPYRARLDSPETLTWLLPDRQRPDVRSVMRIMAVTSKSGLGHVRTIGLWYLGLPELIVTDVPNESLDAAMEVARATAQTLIQNRGVNRPGVIEVDRAKLPSSWPRLESGTGRITWDARWRPGEIHHNAMEVVLTVPGAKAGDGVAVVAALRDYTGGE